jgi:hypothetical protein
MKWIVSLFESLRSKSEEDSKPLILSRDSNTRPHISALTASDGAVPECFPAYLRVMHIFILTLHVILLDKTS